MGPADLLDGLETDARVIMWENPENSLTTPLRLVLCTVVWPARSSTCAIKLSTTPGVVTWNFFLNMWIKVLRGWEGRDLCTLPQVETSLLVTALTSMHQSTVLKHPLVVLSQTRSPEARFPSGKRKKSLTRQRPCTQGKHEWSVYTGTRAGT